jgi:hypothetical protein
MHTAVLKIKLKKLQVSGKNFFEHHLHSVKNQQLSAVSLLESYLAENKQYALLSDKCDTLSTI